MQSIKNYFDNPTFSDLTIQLSDRSVNTHRIILCGKSEYFRTLLTGPFKEGNAKEIELHEDDPQVMVALLRYIYGLLYQRDRLDGGEKWPVGLNALVTLWATARKYLMKDLQHQVTQNIEKLASYRLNEGVITDLPDFLAALRNIFAYAGPEDYARDHMVTACIRNLSLLQKDKEFVSLLKGCGELGAEIITHRDLYRALLGSWMCGWECKETPQPQCQECGYSFDVISAWGGRGRDHWWCGVCEQGTVPVCAHCKEVVVWIQRGVEDACGRTW